MKIILLSLLLLPVSVSAAPLTEFFTDADEFLSKRVKEGNVEYAICKRQIELCSNRIALPADWLNRFVSCYGCPKESILYKCL